MVNSRALNVTTSLVQAYVVVVVATLAVLAVMSAAGSSEATSDAWVHAIVVAVFAVVLPLRLRAAREGRDRALVAVLVIAAVLLVANLVEAVIPGLFPTWMRLEMLGIAALTAAIAVSVLRVLTRR